MGEDNRLLLDLMPCLNNISFKAIISSEGKQYLSSVQVLYLSETVGEYKIIGCHWT